MARPVSRVDEAVSAVKGLERTGKPFEYHWALPVDSTGVLRMGGSLRAFGI